MRTTGIQKWTVWIPHQEALHPAYQITLATTIPMPIRALMSLCSNVSFMDDSYPVTALTITLIIIWTAAWFDLRTLRIPNALSVSGAILGLVIFTSDSGIAGLVHSLSGLGLGLLLMLPGYVLKATAAGDVKLMAAVGGLLGPHRLLGALLYTILVAGVIGLIIALIAWRTRGATAPFKRYGEMIRFLLVTGRMSYIGPRVGEALAGRMPLAVSIAIGTTASLLWPLEFSTPW